MAAASKAPAPAVTAPKVLERDGLYGTGIDGF